MASIDSWRVPRSGYLSFGNRKKSQGAISGEYVRKHLFCDLYSMFILQKIQVFRYKSGGDALHTQNINHNVLSRSVRDIESLWYLSNANTTIFEHNFLYFFEVIVVNRCRWTTGMRQVFYDLTTLTECFMPLKYLRKPMAGKHTLMDVSRSNFTRLSKKVLPT